MGISGSGDGPSDVVLERLTEDARCPFCSGSYCAVMSSWEREDELFVHAIHSIPSCDVFKTVEADVFLEMARNREEAGGAN